MKRMSTSFMPPIGLDRNSGAPIYRQVYEWFRQEITTGQLHPGQPVPSTRGLAADLRVSRISVSAAYEQLHEEGYFETFLRSGTCVANSIPDEAMHPIRISVTSSTQGSGRRTLRTISDRVAAMHEKPETWLTKLVAFRVSLPALECFPANVWSALMRRHLRGQTRQTMAYGEAAGYRPLREAIAQYLGASRAVRCEPSQILVTTGSQQGIHLAAQVLLDVGERVWFEEPGYPGARQAFRMAGAHIVPVPVDEEGLDIAEGIRRAPRPRAAYITPSHQYPLGVTMSASRRMKVLNWAVRSNAWIIEDDYDSEFRFGAKPVPSLQGLDQSARVIYVGTFSKVMFPALRLGYIAVPRDLTREFTIVRDATDQFSSTLHQSVMADFICEGHFATAYSPDAHAVYGETQSTRRSYPRPNEWQARSGRQRSGHAFSRVASERHRRCFDLG